MNQEKQEKKPFLADMEENFMVVGIGISLLLMLITFFAQFFISEEAIAAIQKMSYYAYTWVAGFALSICARDNVYLRVPLVEKHLPEQGKNFLFVIQNIFATILLAIMLVLYTRACMQTAAEGTMDSTAAFIPFALAYAALAVGFILANIRNTIRIIQLLNKKGDK